jgi:hypothetical protein
MPDLLKLYFLFQVFIVVMAIIYTFLYRRRRLKQTASQPPAGFHQTDEVLIDPTTGIKQQVWFNSKTGERFYQNIDEKIKIS